MGGFSWLARRPGAAGDPTHALFAAQSHSIVDNLVALFEHSRSWNCSSQERALADVNGSLKGQRAPSHVRYRLDVMTPGISCIARSPTILRLADTAFEKRCTRGARLLPFRQAAWRVLDTESTGSA